MLMFSAIFVIAGLIAAADAGRSIRGCPEPCSCPLDDRGRRQVLCLTGGLTDPLPVLEMPSDAETLLVEAPEGRPNRLTLGPIFKGHLRLEEIFVVNSGVPALGAHSFWGLRRLRALNISHNEINNLMDTNFRGPESLVDLNLSHNQIESMPSAVFRYIRKLRTLDISHNKVPELVPRIFFGLSKLQKLDLSYNPLGDLPYDRFTDITKLEELSCANCGLLTITSKLFQTLPELRYLNLKDNRMTQVPSVTMAPQLDTVHLDGNHISVLNKGTISWLPLQKLTLSRNRLVKLESHAFANTSLSSIDLSYNRLTNLESGAIDNIVQKLSELDLSGNSLNMDQLLPLLPKARQLRRLGIADLGLSSLPPRLLLHARQLRMLNVSANYLTKFPHELLYSTPHLQALDLSRNSFRGLHNELVTAFKSMGSLRKVYLEGNPWQCEDCHVANVINWLRTRPKQPNAPAACGSIKASQMCLRCVGPANLAGQELVLLNEEQLPECGSMASAVWPTWLGEHGEQGEGISLTDDPRLARENTNLAEANKGNELESVASFFKDHLALLVGVGCGLVLALLLVVVVAVALSRRHSAFYYTCESDAERREKLMGRNNNDSPVTRPASPGPEKVVPTYSPMAISMVHAKTPIRSQSRTPVISFNPMGKAKIATIEEITSLDNGDSRIS